VQPTAAQRSLEPQPYFEVKVVIPWLLVLVIPFLTYHLGRKAKVDDDINSLVVKDVHDFLERIETLARLIAAHQAGSPSHGDNLEKSREHLTTLRVSALAVSNRIIRSFKSEADKVGWESAYLDWKKATAADAGWITNKSKKLSREAISAIDVASGIYAEAITDIRNGIATRRIKLKK
jgi:hypothetical protein